MSIVSKLFSRKSKTLIDPLVGANNNDPVTLEVYRSFRSLGFERDHADAFAAWYVTKTASLAGVVEDEVPNRDSTRSELTCRATTFNGTNQYFSGTGRATSSGKTQLSVAAWVRPTAINGSRGIISEYDAGGNEQSWLMYFDVSGRLIVSISESGSAAGKTYFTANNTLVANEWFHVAFVFDGTQTGGDLTLYLNGKEITPTVTSPNSSVETLFNTTADLQIGAITNGANVHQGEIAHPAIWESALTDAQVRDLYLDDLANVPNPDHAWILDGDKAWTIAGSSTLAPSNTPTRSESEDNPKSSNDFNHAGYTDNAGTIVPAQWGSTTLDAQGNTLQYKNQVARNSQLEAGPSLTFGGTEYATNGSIVGDETVVSNGGTTTPSISAGRIDFTAGTLWNLVLSNGSVYHCAEQYGGILYDDSDNEYHLTLFNSPTRSAVNDDHFIGESRGYSLYEHASTADILIPLKSDGTAYTITPPSGYSKTGDYPAGPYHNDTQATLRGYLANSDSEADIYFGASFDGVSSEIEISPNVFNSTSWKVEATFNAASTCVPFGRSSIYGILFDGSGALRVRCGGSSAGVTQASFSCNGSGTENHFIFERVGNDIIGTVNGVTSTVLLSAPLVSGGVTHIGSSNGFNFLNGTIKNVKAEIAGAIVYESPLYKDSLDRSPNCNHGTDTDITYLNNPATEIAALNPTISSTETLAVTDGNKKLILLGAK